MKKFIYFSVDRWVGLEGIMVMQAYDNKGWKTFHEISSTKQKIGDLNPYVIISKSHYSKMDTKKYTFTGIPGAISSLYLSGSYLFVFLGLFLFTLYLIFSEFLIFNVTSNPLLASIWGFIIAQTIAQLGLSFATCAPTFIMNNLALFALCFLHTKLFGRLLRLINLK